MKQVFALALLAITLVNGRPANDWSKPCFYGECAYDLPPETGSGAIKISGSPKAITDITPSAGWVILDCDPNAVAQDIRLVCNSHDDLAAGCSHLFQDGPIDKLVRLPESCGKGPFARIVTVSEAKDQTIPLHASKKISRRNGEEPKVHMISVDDNFAAIDPSKMGEVQLTLLAANFPGLDGGFLSDSAPKLNERAAASWFSDAIDKIKKAIQNLKDEIKDATTVKGEYKHPFHLVNAEKTVDLIKPISQKCTVPGGSFDASLKITATGKADVTLTVGVAATGSIIPPEFKEFAVMAGASAELDGRLNLDASLTGEIDSGAIRLIQVPITPLNIWSVLSIGPAIELVAQAKATLELNANLEVGINYKLDQVEFWYPPSAGKAREKSANPKDTPLKISASPSIKAKGVLTGTLTPRITVGLDAFNGKAKADAFLEAGASLVLTLTGEASAKVGNKRDIMTVKRAYTPPAVQTLTVEDTDVGSTQHGKRDIMTVKRAYPPPTAQNLAVMDADKASASVTWQGCVDLAANLDINGGVEGKFFRLWEGKKNIDIYDHKWQLFKKCYPTGTKRSFIPPTSLERRAENIGHKIECPKKAVPKATKVEDTVVKAKDIKK